MKDFVSAVGVSFFQGCGQDAAGNYRGGEFQTRFSHQTGRRFISAATTTATAAPRRWRRAHRHHSAAKWVFGDWAQGRERRSFPKLPRQILAAERARESGQFIKLALRKIIGFEAATEGEKILRPLRRRWPKGNRRAGTDHVAIDNQLNAVGSIRERDLMPLIGSPLDRRVQKRLARDALHRVIQSQAIAISIDRQRQPQTVAV